MEMERNPSLIPIACCALYNFIRWENASDRLFGDFDVQDLVTNNEGDTINQRWRLFGDFDVQDLL